MPPSHLSGSRCRTRDLACPVAVGAAARVVADSAREGASMSLAPAPEVPALADRFPETGWDHVEPEVAGWSREKLAKAEAWTQQIGTTAVMVVHCGRGGRAVGRHRGQDTARLRAQEPAQRADRQRRRPWSDRAVTA